MIARAQRGAACSFRLTASCAGTQRVSAARVESDPSGLRGPHDGRRLCFVRFDEGDRLLYPIHRDEGNFAVLKGLSRRILDLADLRKLTARMAVPYRALSPSRTPFGSRPF
jgi:hypothetical protein